MSIARDRANRVGSDPLVIGASKISSNASDDLVVQDTSDNPKRLITSEMQIGDDDNDKIIIKRDSSTGKVNLQTVSGGGSPADQQTGGLTVYANTSNLPASETEGVMALVTANNFMYVYRSGWYKVAEITNATPTISSAGNASYSFATDGTPVSIEVTASDPEGVPLQYKYTVTSGSLTNGGGATAAVTSSATSGGTYSALAENTLTSNKYFKITPSTNTSYAGAFSLTFHASDGVNVANSSASAFDLTFTPYGSTLFDGSGDVLNLGQIDGTPLELGGLSNFTVEGWWKASTSMSLDSSYWNALLSMPWHGQTNANSQIWVGWAGSAYGAWNLSVGEFYINLYMSDGTYEILNSSNTTIYNDNAWHHFALIKNGTSYSLFVDGARTEEITTSKTLNTSLGTRVGYIGGYHNTSGATDRFDFNGYVSNLRVSDNVRYTPSALYGGLDFTGTGYTSLASNSAHDFGTNDFTIEFFYKWDSNSGYQTLVDQYYTMSSQFAIQSNTGTYKWGLWGTGISGAGTYESTNGTQNVWHHYAIVKNGTTIKMYRDGVETMSLTGQSSSIGGTNVTHFSENTHEVTGMVSNYRVVKGTALYTSAGFTIPTTNLTAISGTSLLLFQENSGSTLSDGSSNNITVTKDSGHNILTNDGPFPPTFTVPTSPFDNDSNTLLLTCQKNTGSVADASSNNRTITAVGNAATNSSHPF